MNLHAFSILAMIAFPAQQAAQAQSSSQARASIVERLGQESPPLIIAHRANGGGYPENSLAGIQHAIDTGVEMVRIDVQITGDQRYVLMHNYTLNATTNVEDLFPEEASRGSGNLSGARQDKISDYTLDEIKRLQLTDGQDGGTHSVPSLEDALALIDSRLLTAISIKSYELESLMAVLAGYPTGNLIITSTIDPNWTQEVAAATGIKASVSGSIRFKYDPVGALEGLVEKFGSELVLVGVNMAWVTPELVERAADLGVRLSAYLGASDHALKNGDVSAWNDAMRRGISVFETDYPNTLRDLLVQ